MSRPTVNRSLPPSLRDCQREIEGYARECNLDFYDVIFEMLNYREMNMVAAYGGFPARYPHWRWGMEFDEMEKSYAYGLHRIYEMVINNDPCFAYLLESNAFMDQKMVMAHVYAHCDFFKNNAWFSKTNRKMMNEMANHAIHVRKYIDRYGIEKVERFLDTAISLEHLIDPYEGHILRKRKPTDPVEEGDVPRLHVSREYMEDYINPEAFLEEQRVRREEAAQQQKKFPPEPDRDVLGFLIGNAPLENWQRDILEIIREEATYFAPQGMTKIMNEGWATYWHSHIMTTRALKDSEVIDYADHHSGAMYTQPGGINPYKVGVELFRDIENRWNKGRFGKDYDDCEDIARKKTWDMRLGLGREKIFDIRRFYNDITFIDEYLTEEFCHEHKLFVYDYNPERRRWEISSRDFTEVKQRLLFMLTNMGKPVIQVDNANFENRGELLLAHRHDAVDLDMRYAQETLQNVHRVWNRPVNILTKAQDRSVLLTFDGQKHKETVV